MSNKITVVDNDITVQVVEGSVSSAWGDITGTIANQNDLQAALDGKIDENAAIVGATKTKITYDAKGLVTAGADAVYSDFSFLPTQSGQNGKYLTTDGSNLAWGTVSTANLYNSDGTLTGNRAVTLGGNYLRFVGGTHTSQFTSTGRLLLGTTTESTFLLDVNGTTRTNNVVIKPQSAAPTATAGALYYDSDDNKLKLYDGTNWVDLN